jgi:hypothetical protein
MPKNLIFFGAGASFGSQASGAPTIGSDLFEALQEFNPDGWGALPDERSQLFRDDFEKGMQELSDSHSHSMPPLQRAMAAYFFNFVPAPDSLYARLARQISATNWSGALATLNYERLLELSLIQEGLSPIVGTNELQTNHIEVCLPHGCCHIFCDNVQGSSRGISFSGTGVSTSGEVRVIGDPREFKRRILSDAFPPVMSYFEPKKRTSSGANFIASQRRRWRDLVLNATTIAIVGIAVRPHDVHIWDPLSESSAKIVYCSGSSAGAVYRQWKNDTRPHSSDVVIDHYFAEAFSEILTQVELQ